MAKNPETNANFEQLKQALKHKKPERFYIFYGEEAYLRTYYLNQLHALLIDEVTEAFNYHRFSAETLNPQALQDSLQTLPMMAERAMVQIDDVDLFKRPESEREVYAQLLEDIPDYCTVVLVYDTVEFKLDRRYRALARTMERACAVQFSRPTERELVRWIARHFQQHKQQISFEDCQYLIQLTGGDMTTLQSEIEKLAAYDTGPTVRRQSIDAVVEPVLDAVAFQLSDFIASGRFSEALRTLQTLLQMQTEPVLILGAISTQMRRILTAKVLLSAGEGQRELMSLCGMAGYPASKTVSFAKRLPMSFCEQAVLLCLQTDEKMKSSYDTPQRLLELLVLQLAQEARHA